MTEAERLNEYLICKDRGHSEQYKWGNNPAPKMPEDVKKASNGTARYCKYCNVWFWTVTMSYELHVPKHPKGQAEVS